MADVRALVIKSGTTQNIPAADSLLVGTGIDASAAGALTIGGATATSITIGSASITTDFPGPVQLTGDVTTVGGTTFTSDATFEGNVTFGNGPSDTVTFASTTTVIGDIAFNGAGYRVTNMLDPTGPSTQEGATAAWVTSQIGALVTGVSAVSATAPLLSSGGPTPDISIDTAGAASGDVLTFDGTSWSAAPAAQAVFAGALTVYVDPVNGVDSPNGGTLNKPYASINYAYSQVTSLGNPSNTVYNAQVGQFVTEKLIFRLAPGRYTGDVTLGFKRARVQLIGDGVQILGNVKLSAVRADFPASSMEALKASFPAPWTGVSAQMTFEITGEAGGGVEADTSADPFVVTGFSTLAFEESAFAGSGLGSNWDNNYGQFNFYANKANVIGGMLIATSYTVPTTNGLPTSVIEIDGCTIGEASSPIRTYLGAVPFAYLASPSTWSTGTVGTTNKAPTGTITLKCHNSTLGAAIGPRLTIGEIDGCRIYDIDRTMLGTVDNGAVTGSTSTSYIGMVINQFRVYSGAGIPASQYQLGAATGTTRYKMDSTSYTTLAFSRSGSGVLTPRTLNLGGGVSFDFLDDSRSLAYTPTTPAQWLDPDPTTVGSALDKVGALGLLSAAPANGQIPIGNGTNFTPATISAGSGVSITNGAGTISISATGSGGTVTSVDVSGGTTGLTFSGGPIVGAGTITMAGTLDVDNGGTGATSLTGYVSGNGTSAFTASATIPGSDISGDISGNAANVNGTVAIANGGTGQTTAAAAFGALSPLTTKGDVLGYSTDNARIPVGTDGQVLTADSAEALGVKWSTPTVGTVTDVTASAPLLSSGGPTPDISIDTAGANSGDVLTYNGAAWAAAAPVLTPPGGAVDNVQLNDGAGGFAGSASLSFSASTLTVQSTVAVTDGSETLSLTKDSASTDAATLDIEAASSVTATITGGASFLLTPNSIDALTYAASVAIDLDPSLPPLKSVALTGDITFTTSNVAAARNVSVRVIGDTVSRNLVFPAGWTWLGGAAPTVLEANKVAILSIAAFGATDSTIVASWSYDGSDVVTDVTATGPLASSGGATPDISFPSWPANASGALTNDGAGNLSWVEDEGGTVTSVDVSGGTTGLTFSGGPITTSGTITMAGTLDVANGGTGVATITAGSLVVGDGANAIDEIAPGANGEVLTVVAGAWTSQALPAAVDYSVVSITTAVSQGDAVIVDGTAAIATAAASARVAGMVSATANKVSVLGIIEDCNFEGSLTIAVGEAVYLSASSAGKLTNVAPSASGEVVAELGIIVTVNAAGGGAAAADVLWQPKSIVVL
jgi:hypothetical protein